MIVFKLDNSRYTKFCQFSYLLHACCGLLFSKGIQSQDGSTHL